MKQNTDSDTRNQLLTFRTNILWVYQTNGVYPRIHNVIEKSEAAEFWVVSLKLPELMKAFTFDSGRENEPRRQNELLWQSYFFDGNGQTYMKCWEAQNLLKSMFCCDMSIFLMEMAKLTWNAEKHKTCWKACFVVTCLICFNGNCETYMKCWEAQNLLKNMFCCDMSIFFDGNGETYMKCWEAGHAEKQKIFAEKHVLLWHVYFFDGKIK